MDFAQASQTDTFAAAPLARRAKRPLSAHPAFAPMLGVWGAGLGLAVVLVLPVAVIEAVATSLPADLPAQTARLVLAGSTALLLAVLAYATGRALGRRHRPSPPPQEAGHAAVEPIDPASELGSDSFDAPLPAGLFERDADWLPQPPSPGALAAEAAAELAAVRAGNLPAPTASAIACEDTPAPPCELDLASFAALPGRNAVWVNAPDTMGDLLDADPALEWAEAEPEIAPEPNPDPALVSAIARLRAMPPAELSLCELVERLAAALQDYQATQAVRDQTEAGHEQREAILHEALGALGRVTGEGLAAQSRASGRTLRARLMAEAGDARQQRGAA